MKSMYEAPSTVYRHLINVSSLFPFTSYFVTFNILAFMILPFDLLNVLYLKLDNKLL